MTRKQALRLKPGTEILYGMALEFQYRTGMLAPFIPRWGIILKITERGGILVEISGPKDDKAKSTEEWVPFYNVLQSTGRKFRKVEGRWKQVRGDKVRRILTGDGWLRIA